MHKLNLSSTIAVLVASTSQLFCSTASSSFLSLLLFLPSGTSAFVSKPALSRWHSPRLTPTTAKKKLHELMISQSHTVCHNYNYNDNSNIIGKR
mmetsp:Transcript_38387/g.57508  ORF Transcript_38387/g.57508 Transcript_38387/m.57508 type:complete len:94 (-) Transcript_38387:3251-3532(-)